MSRLRMGLTIALGIVALAATAMAATPGQLNYQGQLTGLDGTPIDTNVSMRFAVYDMALGGTILWAETLSTVAVTGGLFEVILGEVHPIATSHFDGTARYLGVQVGGAAEISPRSRLVSVPYALRAQESDTAGYAVAAGSAPLQGWVETVGNGVVLETITDSVGIGTGAPQAKLDVGGDVMISDKLAVGGGHTIQNSGTVAIGGSHVVTGPVASVTGGVSNTASGGYTVVGGGAFNRAVGHYSVIGGGRANVAGGDYSVVAGGGGAAPSDSNHAFGVASVVSGGMRNYAIGDFATVGGGLRNTASGISSTVAGGGFPADSNLASGDFATVGGGAGNTASRHASTVAGGGGNSAAGAYATVGGGEYCAAFADYATLAGGANNQIDSAYAVIGGGLMNINSGHGAVIAGGLGNKARGRYSAIGGGGGPIPADSNSTTGVYSVVPGGRGNSATGNYSMAAGRRAQALHEGAFVWADATDIDFLSSKPNEFALMASGGLRVIANDLEYGLILRNNDTGDGMRLYSNVSRGNFWGALYASNNGTSPALSVQAGTGLAAYMNGDVTVTGTLSKGAGSFKIDHPLDPANKYLAHSFVESPDMMNVYNGNVILDERGAATVVLPDYFEALNKDYRYQLTCIGGFAPVYVADKITSGRFRIAGGTPGLEVSWQVTGVRQDAYAERHRIQVIQDKPAGERGKYLHPESFGLTRSESIGFDDRQIKDRAAANELR